MLLEMEHNGVHCVFPSQDFFKDSSWFFWKSAAAAHNLAPSQGCEQCSQQCQQEQLISNASYCWYPEISTQRWLPACEDKRSQECLSEKKDTANQLTEILSSQTCGGLRCSLVWNMIRVNVIRVNTAICRIKAGASPAGCVGCLSRTEWYISLLRWWIQLYPLNFRMKFHNTFAWKSWPIGFDTFYVLCSSCNLKPHIDLLFTRLYNCSVSVATSFPCPTPKYVTKSLSV